MDRPFPAYKGDEPYVFVSYAHSNSSSVFPELVWLKEYGFNIWYDEGIDAGTEWREELGQAIKHARLFLYFVTPESVQSENCRKELNFAVDEHIPVLAVHLEHTELLVGVKLTLSDRQAILKYEIPEREYQRKLPSRISFYLDQPIIQPAIEERKKTVLVDLVAMHSIAVLPFNNMSSNEETGFFADGLAEDILDSLAQFENLKVSSRSDSLQFTNRAQDSSVIGEKLKVSYLLEGSVRQQGNDVRITAQLIRTEDGFHVWSKSYERTLADGFEMQTAVATNIAFIIEGKLTFDVFKNYGWKQQEGFEGIDPIAVQHYINAQDAYNNIRLGEGGDWDTRLQFLKNAVQVDPNFYLAYSRLAYAYRTRHDQGRLSLQEARPAAHAAINSAIALAPDDIYSQVALALIQLYLDLDYARAEAGFRQLLKQYPGFPESGQWNCWLAVIALREERTTEALRHIAMASGVNVGSEQAILLGSFAMIRNISGDYEGALQDCTRGLELAGSQDRALFLWAQGSILIKLDRSEEAMPFIEEGWRLDRSTSPEKYIAVFADIGETEKAKKILTDARFNLWDNNELARGHLALGDIDSTFKSIHAGIEDHDRYLITSITVAECWNPIRDDPRFDEMLELLDSKVTHTEQYLRDHNIAQGDQ